MASKASRKRPTTEVKSDQSAVAATAMPEAPTDRKKSKYEEQLIVRCRKLKRALHKQKLIHSRENSHHNTLMDRLKQLSRHDELEVGSKVWTKLQLIIECAGLDSTDADEKYRTDSSEETEDRLERKGSRASERHYDRRDNEYSSDSEFDR